MGERSIRHGGRVGADPSPGGDRAVRGDPAAGPRLPAYRGPGQEPAWPPRGYARGLPAGERVRALVMARRGEIEPALAMARDATDLLSKTDSLVALADAHVGLSEVAAIAGHEAEARESAVEALELYERKGDVVSAEDARAIVERLTAARDNKRLPAG